MFKQRRSLRLQGYDYSQNGLYFVTICTHNRVNCLGGIKDGVMVLNEYGLLVQQAWHELTGYYSNCRLDVYTIMPNHMHGIVEIDNNVGAGSPGQDQMGGETPPLRRIGTLSDMMGYFKYHSTKRINEMVGSKTFQWQRGFYDHIIRNQQDLNRTREYIQNNPMQWDMDEENLKM